MIYDMIVHDYANYINSTIQYTVERRYSIGVASYGAPLWGHVPPRLSTV